MDMHRIVLSALLLGGCGTAGRELARPDAMVMVFADDFHSGIMLEHGDVPAELLPVDVERRWVAVHFGEQQWICGQASGTLAALRLAIVPGDGGVQIDNIDWWVHRCGGTKPEVVRIWVFPVSRRELEGLQARLRTWVASGDPVPIRPGSCWWPSPHDWSLRTNCHDFTTDLLAAAGIRVERPPIMMAGPLRAALDQAWADRDDGH